MENNKVAVLFPGQGAYYGGVLRAARGTYPQVGEVFAAIDATCARMLKVEVSPLLFGANPPGIVELLATAPEVLQMAIYGVSVATYQVLAARGLRPHALLGHSFGEIAALVCAGTFSVGEGAEIVCHRMDALKRLADNGGYMAAVGADAHRTEKMVELVGNHRVVIAGENHRGQTVVSGADDVMEAVAGLARVLQLPFIRLDSPYPFHSPLMAPAVDVFAARLRQLRGRPLQTRVFSPILGRYYADSDVLTDCLAEHLVRPVRFSSSIQQLYEAGVGVFVECGALDTLSKLVHKVVDSPDVRTVACLDPRLDGTRSLGMAVQALRSYGFLREDASLGIGEALLPDADAAAFAAFWAARGPQIASYAREAFAAFSAEHAGAAQETPALIADTLAPQRSTATTAPTISTSTDSPARSTLYSELVGLYAAALEYPDDVFGEDVELEAELGIDSVKQTELLARVSEHYCLPSRPADFRLSDYPTMGKIADFVLAALQRQASTTGGRDELEWQPAPVPLPASAPEPRDPAGPSPARPALYNELVGLYAAALEYPDDVFGEDVELEAELGIDSVKQTELLARVSEHYCLPSRPADFRLSDYPTMGKIADFVLAALQRRTPAASAA